MTLEIELSRQSEEILGDEVARTGRESSEYLHELVEQALRQRALEALKHRKPPQSLADLKPRTPSPPGQNWLESIRGQWPGDESDEEIDRLLEEMS